MGRSIGGISLSKWLAVIIAVAVVVPGVILRFLHLEGAAPLQALIYGIAIVGAAFLLSWAAEVLQMDVSQGLALALLALIAILPEYVVDATFAWLAAREPSYASYAVANMTGANRLLIGVAWPLVVLLVWLRSRRKSVSLEPSHGVEIITLLVATAIAFIIPLNSSIGLIDMAILIAIFGVYMWQLTRMPAEHPELVGPAAMIGSLPKARRRLITGVLGVIAAIGILLVAEPFAHSLVETGALLGIDEFLLVQWLAPLASEAPEFVVVSIFAWRGAAAAALGALVSSKVNQWTLLIAMLPLIYSVSAGRPDSLPLDHRQVEEILLTAAQSLLAIILLLDLTLSLIGAGALFILFAVQLVYPDIHMEMVFVYILCSLVALLVGRKHLTKAFSGLKAAVTDPKQFSEHT